jgi:hypothetical protein
MGFDFCWVVLGTPTMCSTGTISEKAYEHKTYIKLQLQICDDKYLPPAMPFIALNSPTPKLMFRTDQRSVP